ncbi:MAG: amino acid adenylation domain-containing protein [Bacteroidota bacterium]|nr:amino acid adenylation domain-containing protein [Bacteroidota bacterium]
MEEVSRLEGLSPLKRALYEIEELQREIESLKQQKKDDPIAIIGMECRFPGAENIDEFWNVLNNGVDAITEIPASRWNADDPEIMPVNSGKPIPKYGGFISHADEFDAQFFGISPREAMSMDPQQRLLLEVTWHALENANLNADDLAKTMTGVFIGMSNNDYPIVQKDKTKNKDVDAYHVSGNAYCIAANRISYTLDLQGPSFALDSACSSSLLAVHLACQSLRNKESNLAIAGGVSLIFSPIPTITLSRANMLAKGGKCRTFDSQAEGYVRSEGCGIVVLKRLSDALNDKDNIIAIIKSTAVNQDGRTNGLTAPNGLAQKAVILKALTEAQVKPEEISYIEAHGTATSLGDTIEVQALSEVMNGRAKDNPCYIGTVKTNIGHPEAAAGVAALIKTALMLKNQMIPAHLHFKRQNPNIPFEDLPFIIPLKNTKWEIKSGKRIAGVNSFGFGGTNAHIIVEEALNKEAVEQTSFISETEISAALFCASAKNEKALRVLAESYIQFIKNNPEVNLHEVCFTANKFRKTFQHRLSFVAKNKKELVEKLNEYLSDSTGFVSTATEKVLDNFSENEQKAEIAIMAKQYLSDLSYAKANAIDVDLSERQKILEGLSVLFMKGYNIDWNKFYGNKNLKKVSIPLYPFQRQRYWFDGLLSKAENNKSENNTPNDDTSENATSEGNKSEDIKAQKSYSQYEIVQKENDENIKRTISASALKSMTDIERRKKIEDYLTFELSEILKVDRNLISAEMSILYLGLDSITSLELKNKIEENLKVEIAVAFLIHGPSLKELSDLIVKQLDLSAKEEVSVIDNENGNIPLAGEYPLSYGQKAMWYQHQLSPFSIFNPSYAVKVNSTIDVEKLRNALKIVLKRHPLLRVTIHYKDGNLIQRFEEQIGDVLFTEDLTGNDTEQIRRKINEQSAKNIDLEKGPLFKIHLFKVHEQEYYICMISHHIITDMWSLAVILNELSLLYTLSADEKMLPAGTKVKKSYIDYIQKQELELKGERGKLLWEYWKNKLSGKLPVLDLPIDNARPQVQSFKGSSRSIFFSQNLTEEIHNISKQFVTTPFVLLLSAFNVLLHRYSLNDDIIVGTPFAGRTSKDFNNTVGYFVNPVAIRTRVQGDLRFCDLIENVRQSVREASEYQDYPINLIIEDLNPERQLGRPTLFQVMFVFQHAQAMDGEGLSALSLGIEGAELSFAGLKMESVKIDEQVSPFDLTLMMAENDKSLCATMTYNSDLFNESTITRLLSHFQNILSSIVSYPEQLIRDINLLDVQEFERLKFVNAQKEFTEDAAIGALFEKQVKLTPSSIALIYKDEKVTYDELNQKANNLAHHLISSGIKKEDIVAIDTGRSIEMIIAMLAVLKAGAAYLPFDYMIPKARKLAIIKSSGAKAVIVKDDSDFYGPDDLLNLIRLNKVYDKSDAAFREDPGISVDKDNLAYVIYTSGSTGRPKGVVVNHKGLVNTILSLIDKYRVHSHSRVLQFASPSFDASAQEIYMTLLTGAALYIVDQQMVYSAPSLISFIEENKITHLTFPPSMLSIIPEDKLSTLQVIVSAGEACSKEIAEKWSRGHLFINAYGPTETSICSCCFHVTEKIDAKAIPIGFPIDNAQMYICSDEMNILPPGVQGEILIGGRGVARGYLNDPELTAEKFIPDPFSNIPGQRLYRTGDIAKYLPDMNIEFIGRKDYQLKIRGNRIEVEEIEKLVKSYPSVLDAAIIPSSNMDSIVGLFLADDSFDSNIDLDKLNSYLKENLPGFMIPSKMIRLSEFQYSLNGKVDRKALAKKYTEQISSRPSTSNSAKPQTEIESIISEVWKEVLSNENIGIHDNFFDIGGHSLAAAKVQIKLQEKFGKELSIVDLFRYPNIFSLAKFISSGNNEKIITENITDRVQKQKAMVNLQRYKTISKRSS